MVLDKLEKYANLERYKKNSFSYLVKPLILSALVLSLNPYFIQAQGKGPKKPSFVEKVVCEYFGDKPNTEENITRAKNNTQILRKDNFMFSTKVRIAYLLGSSKGIKNTLDKAVSRSSFEGDLRKYALKKRRFIKKRAKKLHRQYD